MLPVAASPFVSIVRIRPESALSVLHGSLGWLLDGCYVSGVISRKLSIEGNSVTSRGGDWLSGRRIASR